MATKPKHKVEYDSDWSEYSIAFLSLPKGYEMRVGTENYREVLEVRKLLESVAQFLDTEWETRLDYPYEIDVRL